MAAVDTVFMINFILNIAIAVTGIIVAMLIPSTRKIREGRAGTGIGSPWILIILILMVIVSLSVLPVTIAFLDGRNLYFGLALDAIAIGVTVLAVREYFSARKAYRELGEMEELGTVSIANPPHHSDHAEPLHPVHHEGSGPGAGYMTVECPQCGRHIHVAEGSDTITCPYCGLSGTL